MPSAPVRQRRQTLNFLNKSERVPATITTLAETNACAKRKSSVPVMARYEGGGTGFPGTWRPVSLTEPAASCRACRTRQELMD